MEDPNLWRDNPRDRAYDEGYRKGREDALKEIKYMTEINDTLENMINSIRKVQSIECPCVGCKRTESDHCGLRAFCVEFRKWKEAEDGIHSEGEA